MLAAMVLHAMVVVAVMLQRASVIVVPVSRLSNKIQKSVFSETIELTVSIRFTSF